MTEMTSVGEDFERTMRLKLAIQQTFEENAELLERLRSEEYHHEGGPS